MNKYKVIITRTYKPIILTASDENEAVDNVSRNFSSNSIVQPEVASTAFSAILVKEDSQ